uniref:Vexin n=1 Tax=Strix occidentalis caurina TaxID=311401 RepID=A0A8D0KQD3_STROC
MALLQTCKSLPNPPAKPGGLRAGCCQAGKEMGHLRHSWRKTAEYDLTLPPAAEASLPLTGGNLCGTPSLLRKMWMKHKKKSEYLGATNSAFEAD